MPLAEQWGPIIERLGRISRRPILVGEFGRRIDLPDRDGWLRSLRDVQGVDAAVYFDMDLPFFEAPSNHWLMDRPMREVYASLPPCRLIRAAPRETPSPEPSPSGAPSPGASAEPGAPAPARAPIRAEPRASAGAPSRRAPDEPELTRLTGGGRHPTTRRSILTSVVNERQQAAISGPESPVAVPRAELLRRGLRLEYLTIGWNVLEGLVAIGAGLASGSIALVGFGLDSLVETTSGVILVWRLRVEQAGADDDRVEQVERRAERLVGDRVPGAGRLRGVRVDACAARRRRPRTPAPSASP